MLIGAHMPTFGDFRKVAAYAAETRLECVQVFGASPRTWAVPATNQKTFDQLRQARLNAAAPLPKMLVHAGYLINLASDDPEQLAKSCDSLAAELVRAAELGADAINVHTGSSKELSRAEVPRRIARVVFEALEIAGERAVPIVFEDTAGAGTTYGTTMTELGAILDGLGELGVPRAAAGICIDTCHAWAAGYDVASDDGWRALLDEVERACGLDRLRWIHANDSKFGRGERKDRHEWIGQGRIGEEGFKAMVRRPELTSVDVVVEMPGEMPEKDAVNVALLRRWRDEG